MASSAEPGVLSEHEFFATVELVLGPPDSACLSGPDFDVFRDMVESWMDAYNPTLWYQLRHQRERVDYVIRMFEIYERWYKAVHGR